MSLWDKVIEERRLMEYRGLTPVAVVMTEADWNSLTSEWYYGFNSGPRVQGQRRLNGLPVALVDPDYEGPAVLGVGTPAGPGP